MLTISPSSSQGPSDRRGSCRAGTLAHGLASMGFAAALVAVCGGVGSAQLSIGGGPDTDKLAGRVGQFVRSKQRQLEFARKKLLKAIDNVQRDVKHSEVDPDAKRLLLQMIKSDRQNFVDGKELPSCDELLEHVIAYAEANQSIVASIDDFRKKISDKEIRNDSDPDVSKALAKLENDVMQLLGGRVDVNEGSQWNGTRHNQEGDAAQLSLQIDQVAGNVFRGRLEQSSNLATSIMRVEGQRDGHYVVIRTTEMIRGEYRSLEFSGYILGRRIVVSVDGLNTAKKRATGYISLWKQQ
jgi:hypothetical protein